VRHIVLLSSIWAAGDPVPAMGRWHHEREELLRATRTPATILRPGGFTTNGWPTRQVDVADGRYYSPLDDPVYDKNGWIIGGGLGDLPLHALDIPVEACAQPEGVIAPYLRVQ
jgi:hypothetical protein